MKSKQQKRHEALAREIACELLSPRERLQVLDSRLGVNVGATKERARLYKLGAINPNPPRGEDLLHLATSALYRDSVAPGRRR